MLFTKVVFSSSNSWVSLSDFWVTINGHFTISRYCYLEVVKFPVNNKKFSITCIDTWKSLCEYLNENENIFKIIFGFESMALVLLIHEKKTRARKYHATVPLTLMCIVMYKVYCLTLSLFSTRWYLVIYAVKKR